MQDPQYAIEQNDPVTGTWNTISLCADWQAASESIERLKQTTGYLLRITKLGGDA